MKIGSLEKPGWMIVLGSLLAAPVLAGCLGGAPGGPAPGFAVVDSEGVEFSLSDFEGQRVLLFFGSMTSCPTCVTSTRNTLVPLHAELEGAVPFLTLSVASFETDRDLNEFKERHGAAWPHALDSAQVAIAYEVWQLSTVVVLDEEHEVVMKRVSPSSDRLRDALAA